MALREWLTAKSTTKIFVRFFHTALTAGIVGSILYKHTELSEAVKSVNLAYVLLYFLLMLGSLAMYFAACWVNPGYVALPSKHKSWNNNSDEEDNVTEQCNMLGADQQDMKLRKCGFCGITQPLRARHCEECGRCVQKYDHHCPWLETCVGENNHKFFWLFVISETALIVWTAWIVWHGFVFRLSWGDWIQENIFFLVDMVVLCVGGLVTTCLSFMHTYMMVTNTTTWEMVSRERISYLKMLDEELNPFHEGYCKNMYKFMCQRGQRKWEALYKKKTATRGLDV